MEKKGGNCGSLTHKTNFLVIGVYATESWKHSSYGLKIEKAVKMKQEGIPIFVVGENSLGQFARGLSLAALTQKAR